MGFFRFRRSIKILPGVRWNFGKKSTSLSIGPRGAHYTFGTSGSRTTVGIPGTGLSYTDIHSSHRRIAGHHAGVPIPSEDWINSHQVNVTLHIPERENDEPPIRRDQLDLLSHMRHVNMKGYDLKSLGSGQADSLISQIQIHQKEVSKTLLKQFYAGHGHTITDSFIDHCYDHPDQPWVQSHSKSHGCLILIGILLFVGWLGNFVGKESQTAPPNPKATPHSLTSNSSDSTETQGSSSGFPDSRFWPIQVRILAPVVLSGTVGGGTISELAKPGEILDASLSRDHRTVTLRRLGITGSLPVDETDFVARATKTAKGDR